MKEKFNALDLKYRELEVKVQVLSVRNRRLELKHECLKHPEADESTTDPLVKLKEPLFHRIMKYLNKNELLTAMQVSVNWKQFIISSSLMNQVKVKPNVWRWSVPLAKSVLFGDPDQIRPYQHMECPIWVKLASKVFSISRYASTLETLTIPDADNCGNCYRNNDEYEADENIIEDCEFPKLQRLSIYHPKAIFFFKNCSFPAVTELMFKLDDYHIKSLREILRNFPQLKGLKVKSFKIHDKQQDPLTIEADKRQPKIEKLHIGSYHSEFMKDQQKSLQHLKTKSIIDKQLVWLLRDMKALKSLQIKKIYLGVDDDNFPQNDSIKYLKVYNFSKKAERLYYDASEASSARILQFMRNLFLALPSLKELEIENWSDLKITAELIQLIGE